MYGQQSRNWLKHIDFMVIDVVCMQLCFCLGYWTYIDFSNPYRLAAYQYQATLLMAGQLLVILFSTNYQGIIRRGLLAESIAVGKYITAIAVMVIVYLFVIRQSTIASRVQLGLTFVYFLVIDLALRQANKARIRRFGSDQKKSLALITSSDLADDLMAQLTDTETYIDYFVSRIILLDDGAASGLEKYGVPIERLSRKAIDEISHSWVDEVFIMQPENITLPSRLMDDLLEMGMTVSYSSTAISAERWPMTDVKKLAGHRVITSSIRMASAGQVALKRLLDIVGGIVGCAITAILFVFVAPAIFVKSPGPIFFAQKRIGRNGKVFNMYKFRSMYPDAEARKAELMSQNNIADGMMFKMTDDPRIIGSEKKGPDGKPKGIGNFIRNTSIDEFPQFINVLKGDMSLVGTRPPTLDEWEKYDLDHRARMSIKPGITGLWQISGRSEITDFHEVVRLDREYIENWNIALDVKIILKTVVVVLQRKGVS